MSGSTGRSDSSCKCARARSSMPVLAAIRRAPVSGLANITGGGLRNLVRLKPNVEFRITEPLPPPPEFRAIQDLFRWIRLVETFRQDFV